MDDALDEYGRPTAGGSSVLAHAGPVVPPMPAVARSGKWPALLRETLAAHPTCPGCRRPAETAHHVVPFGADPARELDAANLVAVCVPCHFVLCHGGDWRTYVPGCLALLLARHLAAVAPIRGAQ